MHSHNNLTIKGEGCKRIPISDCKLQPLNLLIPGGAPVLVPKHKSWPGANKGGALKLSVPLPTSDSYDSMEEDGSSEGPVATKTRSKRASRAKAPSPTDLKVKPKKKPDGRCKKTTRLERLAIEAKQPKKLGQQPKDHGKYVAKLRAKYAAKHTTKTRDKAPDSDPECNGSVATNSTTENESQASNASTSGQMTDASEEVCRMIKSLKIKAAGADDAAFNASDDAQILARKEAGESFATIAKFMGRTKKQISKRHQELMALGKKAETAGARGPGESSEAPAGTGNGAPADAIGGLLDLGALQAKLEATAEEQAQAEGGAKEEQRDQDVASHEPKSSPVGIPKGKKGDKKKSKKGPKLNPPAAAGGESGYESGPDDVSTKIFIGNYARHLLTDQSTIPDADDKFDEEDCILMAVSDARRKADRWRQMQADFANLTGRMVPVEVLKYKFGEGEKPEGY